MSDTDEKVEGQETEGQEGKEGKGEQDLQALLQEMIAQQTAMAKKLETISTPPAKAPEPKSKRVPARKEKAPTGVIARAEYDELVKFASDQAKELERLKLIGEFGLEPDDLKGEYGSPEVMRQHAEMLAMRKQMSALEERLQEKEGQGEGEEAPPEDTGGPTGKKGEGLQAALDTAYQQAREAGPTESARRALLQTLYRDPTKRQAVVPEQE